MADDIVIRISGNISAGVAKSIRDIGAAALEAESSLDILRNALKGFSSANAFRQATADTREFRNEVNRATKTTQTFTAATDASAKSLLSGARAAEKYGTAVNQANSAGKTFIATSNQMRGVMGTLVGLFASGFALHKFVEASDQLVTVQNRLRVVGYEGEALTAVMGRLTATALRNGQSMDALSMLYMKAKSAATDLGAGEAQLDQFVRAVAASLKIQGGSANTSAGAILQLSQAIGTARVEAQEFNSIMEGAYPLAQAAARGLDQFGGSATKLQAFIRDGGTITGKQLFEAITKGLASLEEAAAKTQLTISQSLQNLQTQFSQWTANATAGTDALSLAIQIVGANLDIIIPAIAAFAAAWLAVKAATILTEIVVLMTTGVIPALASGTVAMLAFIGPWGLLTAAVVTVAAAIAYFTGNLDGFISTMGDALGQLGEMAMKMLRVDADSVAATTAVTALSGATGLADTNMQSFGSSTDSATSSLRKFESAGVSAANAVARSFQKMTAAANAAADAAYKALQSVGGTSGSFTAVPTVSNPSTYSSDTFTRQKADGSFAQGGSAKVRGRAGVDNNLVKVRLSKGERMDILTPAQQRRSARAAGGGAAVQQTININISTPNADSFNRSRQQVSRAAAAAMSVGY